ncbi:MAG: ATP-binding protein [Alphaproteobacteria bacterium]|nr:ATP-binding protein [Alphaproteobacteria bacterium]
MTRQNRIVLFLFFILGIFGLFYLSSGNIIPVGQTDTILFACLMMLAFSILFVEHFFTKPADVLASNIAILLMLSPLREHLDKMGIWYTIFYSYNLVLLFSSFTALFLLDSDKSEKSFENTLSSILKKFAVHFGNAKVLYGGLFILTMLFYVDSQSIEFLLLFLFSSLILFCEPKKFIDEISIKKHRAGNDIGEIIGVQSRNIFLTKLFTKRVPVKRFDFVQFRYAMGSEKTLHRGMIVDNYFLNQEQWVKVLSNNEIRQAFAEYPEDEIKKDNILYKLEQNEEKPEFLDRFVGVVIDGSTIQRLRFEYGQYAKMGTISEGALLTVNIRNTPVLYQVVQGITEVETLESKNESGFIVGEAVQLGVWNADKTTFEKFGWVPEINSPVYVAPSIDEVNAGEGETVVGSIPDTNYPAILRMDEAVTHHTAILGVTGVGKSVFSRQLIKDIVENDTKAIIVDFTGEHKDKLQSDLAPKLIIPSGTKLADYKSRIKSFLDSDEKAAIFEIPDMADSAGMFRAIDAFFNNIFLIAKENKANENLQKICIVLEEAHTVVPEWNFISEREYQNIVNRIAQIALQGRKYEVGFIVIAQRTANVAKTILTQCNTIIAFRQFDNTSSEFLANYLGPDMIKALPSLEDRTAIAVGKAFKANIPMIFRVPDIEEN